MERRQIAPAVITAAALVVATSSGCRTASSEFAEAHAVPMARSVELSDAQERSAGNRTQVAVRETIPADGEFSVVRDDALASDTTFSKASDSNDAAAHLASSANAVAPETHALDAVSGEASGAPSPLYETFEWATDESDLAEIQLTAAASAGLEEQGEETPTLAGTLPPSEDDVLGVPPALPSVEDGEGTLGRSDSTVEAATGLTLEQVISSVYSTYPLLQASITQRQRAAGNQLSTWGAFDRNLKASTENQPVGFYETYRHKFGVSRNIYKNGGDWFAQYQLGRGNFEPWYLEREKNEGGEFSAGFTKPLLQGRDIDARRAAIWRATFERQRVEPAIRRDLIMFVLDASASYWNWVAAGQRYQLAKTLLDVAEERNRQLRRQVEEGFKEAPLLPENRRLILNRQGALLDASRTLEQASATLSLFYRDFVGTPLVVDESELPTSFNRFDFEIVGKPDVMADLSTAVSSRPELFELEAQRRQINVTLAESQNNLLPKLDLYAVGRQNVGGRTSSKNDKQPFQYETGLRFDVPIERRAARGQIAAAQAEMARISAEMKFIEEQILTELQVAAAMIEAASGRVEFAAESITLAEELLKIEKKRFREGLSSLLELTLREQQFAESTEALIAAQFDLNIARAAYRAALGIDRLPDQAP